MFAVLSGETTCTFPFIQHRNQLSLWPTPRTEPLAFVPCRRLAPAVGDLLVMFCADGKSHNRPHLHPVILCRTRRSSPFGLRTARCWKSQTPRRYTSGLPCSLHWLPVDFTHCDVV